MAVVDTSPELLSIEEDELQDSSAIRIILADSQAIYRVGMRKVFALEDDIRVVAQAETLPNLYAALVRFPTDVVVLEGQLLAGTVDAIPELVRRAPRAKLIVQSGRERRVEHGGNCTGAACAGWFRDRFRRIC